MTRIATILVVLLCLASPAFANVPDPANSTVDACLVICPAGDFNFRVVVRDFAGNPITNSTVELDFSTCSGFVVCPPSPSDGYTYDGVNRRIRAVTAPTGVVDFRIRGGGVCGGSVVRITADGVILAQRSLASPDQNSSLLVDGTDIAIVVAKLGAADPTADFDCDGLVTQADVNTATLHDGHRCQIPTASHPGTWGRLKLLYR